MLSRISRSMATENCTEVSLKEANQSPIGRQVENPKWGLRETNLADPPTDTAEPPKKIGGFDLSFDSSSSGEIKPEIADYANKHIRNDLTNQTLLEGILAKNPIS